MKLNVYTFQNHLRGYWSALFLAFLMIVGYSEFKTETFSSKGNTDISFETIQDANWESLFDGENLSGWRGLGRDHIPESHWIVEDGAIRKVATDEVARVADGQPVEGGDLLYDRTFKNFELSLEWKVSPGANSGIKYNVSEELSTSHEPAFAALGFEYQILDNELHPDAENDPNRLAAGLYDLIPPGSNASLNPVGTWNTGRIVFNGNKGEHWLNGEMVLEYELETYMMDRLLETSKWGDIPEFGARRDEGYIILQDHGDDVWFRNIRLRELKSEQ
ncbi:MAG: DUF1080 domain-containing protein [Balneolales bacterium]